MSAREEFFEAMAGGWSLTASEAEGLNRVIDAFMHGLAEEIRQDAQSRHDRDFSDNRIFRLTGAQAAADLIDPQRPVVGVRQTKETP